MPKKRKIGKGSWKDVQSKNRVKRQSKLAIGVLGLIVGVLLLSWVVQFTQKLFTPWKLQTNIKRNYTWNGEFNINLLVKTDRVAILSYNPKEEKIVILEIPDNAFVEVPYGYKYWQIRAVYELGQSNSKIGGQKLLMDTLTSFLAIPIDGFLDFSNLTPQKSTTEIVSALGKNPFSGFGLLSSLRTDLTLFELLKLKNGIGSVRFDKIKQLDLEKLNILDKERLPDGTEVLTGSELKLDSVLSDFKDPTIVAERRSIAVFNATEFPQVAGKMARLITNLGGNVIITGNSEEKLEKSESYGEKSQTLKRVRQILNLSDKISTPEETLDLSRADINLQLGADFVNR